MTATETYSRLLAEFQEAEATAREIPQAQQRAQQEAARLGQRLVEEHDLPADGSPPTDAAAKKAWAEWVAAKQRAEGPWAERLARAKRERDRRESLASKFANEHLGELLAERAPEVREAHENLLDSLQQAISAIERLEGEAGAIAGLTRYVVGFNVRSEVPSLQLDGLRRELRNVLLAGVPVPLPGFLFDEEAFEAEDGEVLHPADAQRRAEAQMSGGGDG